MSATICELCSAPGGIVVWRDDRWRVVRVEDANFPAFYRVICNDHVGEFSDLLAHERNRCMNLVVAVERALREQLLPAKVNLASLGNMTPHLHWHVIARFAWDSNFPRPVWDAPLRQAEAAQLQALRARLLVLDAAIAASLR